MYPDKRLFGKEPGEALNEDFYARSWVNTALVGYPELELVLGVDPSELQEIDNILGPHYRTVCHCAFVTKEAPVEYAECGYKDVTITIYERFVSGRECTQSWLVTFE